MSDTRRPVWVPVAAVAAVVLAVVVLLVLLARPAAAEGPTVLSFTDEHGRACTQTSTDVAVAIDCDFPPAENRLGGWLDDLNSTTQP